MGKIIKFDPDRRRKRTRSWTRPEDYGAQPAPKPRPKASRQPERTAPPSPLPAGRAGWQAKLAVAAIILAGVATSLYDLT